MSVKENLYNNVERLKNEIENSKSSIKEKKLRINDVSKKISDILKKNNENIEDSFPISISKDAYIFTFDEEIKKWKKEVKFLMILMNARTIAELDKKIRKIEF